MPIYPLPTGMICSIFWAQTQTSEKLILTRRSTPLEGFSPPFFFDLFLLIKPCNNCEQLATCTVYRGYFILLVFCHLSIIWRFLFHPSHGFPVQTYEHLVTLTHGFLMVQVQYFTSSLKLNSMAPSPSLE